MDRGEQLSASGAQVVTPEAARELIGSHFDVSPYERATLDWDRAAGAHLYALSRLDGG